MPPGICSCSTYEVRRSRNMRCSNDSDDRNQRLQNKIIEKNRYENTLGLIRLCVMLDRRTNWPLTRHTFPKISDKTVTVAAIGTRARACRSCRRAHARRVRDIAIRDWSRHRPRGCFTRLQCLSSGRSSLILLPFTSTSTTQPCRPNLRRRTSPRTSASRFSRRRLHSPPTPPSQEV
jgi:hypothetical protein